MPTVNFQACPTSNATACWLLVDGCGMAGNLRPGDVSVLSGGSPGVSRLDTFNYYFWTQDATLLPGTVCVFSACTPTTLTMQVINHAEQTIEEIELELGGEITVPVQGGEPSAAPA